MYLNNNKLFLCFHYYYNLNLYENFCEWRGEFIQ